VVGQLGRIQIRVGPEHVFAIEVYFFLDIRAIHLVVI
jgi:hypothetical protein